MNRMHKFFGILLLLTSYSLQAQNEVVVKIDPITKVVNKKLPFDKSFIIQIPTESKDSKTISNVFLYRAFVKKGNRSPEGRTSFYRKKILGEKLKTRFEEKKGSLYIYVDPLDPNTYLDIVLEHKFKGKKLDELLAIHAHIADGDLVKAKSNYDAMLTWIEQTEADLYPTLPLRVFGRNWDNGRWNGYQYDYNHVKEFYDALIEKPIAAVGTGFVYAIDTSTIAELTKVNFGKMATCAAALDLSSSELPPFEGLLPRRSSKFLDFLKGKRELATTAISKPISEFDLKKRVASLDSSIHQLKLLLAFGENLRLRMSIPEDIIVVTNVMADLTDVLLKLKENRDHINDNFSKIKTVIDTNTNLRYTQAFILDNQFSDSKTEAGFRVTPDIGYAVIKAYGNLNNEFIHRPYFGVNITFRPVDKQIRFREYQNRAYWQQVARRVSLNLGVTTSKLPDDSEFEDLYNKASLLVGINFRIFRGLYISSGGMFLKQINPNPIITEADVELAPYVGISIDVEINKLLSSVTGKFL